MKIKIVALSDINVTIPELPKANLVPRALSLPPLREYLASPHCRWSCVC